MATRDDIARLLDVVGGRRDNTGAQSSSVGGIPLDDARTMYANGERDIPASDYGALPSRFTSKGWQPFPSGAKPALYASNDPEADFQRGLKGGALDLLPEPPQGTVSTPHWMEVLSHSPGKDGYGREVTQKEWDLANATYHRLRDEGDPDAVNYAKLRGWTPPAGSVAARVSVPLPRARPVNPAVAATVADRAKTGFSSGPPRLRNITVNIPDRALSRVKAGGPANEQVAQLQTRLKNAMPNVYGDLVVDGKFGPVTEAAVRSFNQHTGDPTKKYNIAGPHTFDTLDKIEQEKQPVPLTSGIQEAINRLQPAASDAPPAASDAPPAAPSIRPPQPAETGFPLQNPASRSPELDRLGKSELVTGLKMTDPMAFSAAARENPAAPRLPAAVQSDAAPSAPIDLSLMQGRGVGQDSAFDNYQRDRLQRAMAALEGSGTPTPRLPSRAAQPDAAPMMQRMSQGAAPAVAPQGNGGFLDTIRGLLVNANIVSPETVFAPGDQSSPSRTRSFAPVTPGNLYSGDQTAAISNGSGSSSDGAARTAAASAASAATGGRTSGGPGTGTNNPDSIAQAIQSLQRAVDAMASPPTYQDYNNPAGNNYSNIGGIP